MYRKTCRFCRLTSRFKSDQEGSVRFGIIGTNVRSVRTFDSLVEFFALSKSNVAVRKCGPSGGMTHAGNLQLRAEAKFTRGDMPRAPQTLDSTMSILYYFK